MFEVVGQDIISGNMGFIGTDPDRLYRMGAAEKTEDVTVTGNPAVLDNATGKPFRDLHIYGRSEQVTTTGAQLLDLTDLIGKTETKNGATYKINEDQSISVSGTPTEYTSFYLKRMQLKAGSYYFKRNQNNNNVFIQILGTQVDMNDGFTLDEDADAIGVYVVFNVSPNNKQEFNLTFASMLNAGETPLPWEPYTGGKPSPSPEYPQEIKSVVNPIVKVCGKNLLELTDTQVQEGKLKFEINQGIVVFDGSVDDMSFIYKIKDFVVPNDGTYTITTNSDNNSNDSPRILISINGGSYESAINGVIKKLSTGDTVTLYIRISTTGSYDGRTIKPMIEFGSTATAYEPYHEPQSMSVTTPNGLPGIPVSSDGNYTDENGQQWICDEVDFGRGVYVKRIGSLILDDKSKINSMSSWDNTHLDVIQPYRVTGINMLKRKVVCDRLPTNENEESWNKDIELIGGVGNPIQMDFNIKNQRLGTTKDTSPADAITAVLKWLKDNPLSCKYALATPIETPLTAAEISAYKSLRTYRGTTIVEAEDKAGISATYKCNTKAAEKEVNILHADLMAEMEELDENSEIV